MTNPEHQRTPDTASEREPMNVILTEPGQPGHARHPCVWLSTPPSDNDPFPTGLWVCLAHPQDLVRATIADVIGHHDLPAQASVQDMVGFDSWTPMPGDDIDTYLAVAQGIATHGAAFAAWADMVVDLEMFDSFTDSYNGTFGSPTAWAEAAYGTEVEGYLDRTIRPDLRPFIHADYAALADHAVWQGRVTLYPTKNDEVHAFTVPGEPGQ